MIETSKDLCFQARQEKSVFLLLFQIAEGKCIAPCSFSLQMSCPLMVSGGKPERDLTLGIRVGKGIWKGNA